MLTYSILRGDCREIMAAMPEASVHCCVTSPPYWGLRDYGHAGQLGLESTPEEYVARMVDVFREVRRVLREDGTAWLNLGDTYSSGGRLTQVRDTFRDAASGKQDYLNGTAVRAATPPGLKPKDLIGIPWRVAFALQADGWYLRSDIIWHKPNPMPESVTDRPTKAHEYMFLLSKSERYFYDAAAIAEPAIYAGDVKDYTGDQKNNSTDAVMQATRPKGRMIVVKETRNRRTVWTIPTQPFSGAHFAVMPEALVAPCILAGSPEGGTAFDPFAGSGTVGVVALKNGRNFIGCELNPEYVKMARKRLSAVMPLFSVEMPDCFVNGVQTSERGSEK